MTITQIFASMAKSQKSLANLNLQRIQAHNQSQIIEERKKKHG